MNALWLWPWQITLTNKHIILSLWHLLFAMGRIYQPKKKKKKSTSESERERSWSEWTEISLVIIKAHTNCCVECFLLLCIIMYFVEAGSFGRLLADLNWFLFSEVVEAEINKWKKKKPYPDTHQRTIHQHC